MFSVEPLKGFLDVSVEFLGSVIARFVDLSVIEKGHAFVSISEMYLKLELRYRNASTSQFLISQI